MKRIEIHHAPAYKMSWHVYQITEQRSFLLATCLTEEIANKVKEALES